MRTAQHIRCTIRRSLILVAAMILGGCISDTSVFHSADGKQTGVCSASGFGIVRGTLAIREYHRCREAYLKDGYIEEPTTK